MLIQYICNVLLVLLCPLHHFLSYITNSVASFLTKVRISRLHPPKSHTEVGCIQTMLPQVCFRQYSVKASLICIKPFAVMRPGMFMVWKNSHDVI